MIFRLESDSLKAARNRFGQPVEVTEPRVGHRPIGINETVDRHVLCEHYAKELGGLGT